MAVNPAPAVQMIILVLMINQAAVRVATITPVVAAATTIIPGAVAMIILTVAVVVMITPGVVAEMTIPAAVVMTMTTMIEAGVNPTKATTMTKSDRYRIRRFSR